MGWPFLRRLLRSEPSNPAKNVEDAAELRGKHKKAGWYEVTIYARKENPITEYRVELTPTNNPPPEP
jgi:hypothetical protein